MFTKAENMTSAAVSQFYDVGLVLQNKLSQIPPMERRNTVSAPVNRNFAIGNFSTMGLPPQANVIPMDNQTLQGLTKDHRKLDRSYSEPCDKMNNNLANLNNSSKQQQQQQQQGAVNSSRYKTELCRPFEESGHCKYADKCQFAHGIQELKHLQRHPKYKTELCRTFHSKGFCPYGPRCNFIHNDQPTCNQKMNEKNNVVTVQQAIQHQQATQYFQHISPPSLSQSPPPPAQRPSSISFNSSFSGSMGSVTDSSPPSSVSSGSPSLSPVFFGEEAPVVNSSCYNLPINNSLNYDNSTNTVFNSLSELASMGPLNVQTQLSSRDLAAFTQNFSTMLNLNTHCNSGSGDEWEPTTPSLFGQMPPPSSPDSISGESVSSTNSFSSSNTYSSCGSPMDVGKNLRLPVFNMISQD